MKQQNVGILVTLSQEENGRYLIRYDDVERSSSADKMWKEVRPDTEYSVSEDKMNQRADYGMTEDVKQKGKIPIRFGLGTNLLSAIKTNKKIYGFDEE